MYTGIDDAGRLRPVRWIGTSLRDLRLFPREVRGEIGQAIFTAQKGGMDPAAKPLKGFGGAGVIEIVSAFQGNAWRAVYTVRFRDGSMCCMHFRKNRPEGSLRRHGRSS